ncbi:NAK protein kinase [Aphanomyces invadans]|uniref:NAK protein kinase n=1 Tax=Aphanomyces invadans TaxID=157072 RepID=A0A024UEQ9_9STRA|nr:NAK protein kinase [Aphanomyces invadans]ETW04118.1 NAK protein kinase [Aphanomyces invadans]|eukprot:XP_008867074.1 NAK protein kinase [Aphanomyces invadans]
MLVLYDVLGEVGSSERHPNAFRVSDSVHPIRLKDVQDACPFEHCHFSFQHENGVFGSYTNPNSVVPIVNRSRIRAKIVVSAGPVAEKGVHHDDVIHVMAASAGTARSSSRTNSSSSQSSSQRKSTKDQDHAAPWEATFGDNPSRDSSGGSNTSRGAEGSSALGGISTAEIKEKLKKQTEIAKDFAKNLHVDDMKRNAVEFAKTMNLDETARKAKKWGGSLLSSISNSISSASNAMSKVNIVRLLAEGGYGQVFLVKTVGSNETCALKRVVITSAEVESDAAIERQVYQNVHHPHVMRMLQYGENRSSNKHEALFLLPFYDHGTLWDAILRAANDTDQPWPFDERRILNIFQGIASGVAALHAAGFAHRDLKPHNVLLDHRDHSILMDFGSCAPLVTEIADRRTLMLVQENANRKCSAPYRAPELFEPEVGHIVNGQSDVWSLGCLLFCMAFGSSPFENSREGFLRLACLNGKVPFPPTQGDVVRFRGVEYSIDLIEFIKDMLHLDPSDRPSMTDVVEYTAELLHGE